MKLSHSITASVFCKPEDSREEVEKAFLSLFPFNLEEEKIAVSKQAAAGFNERKIAILEVQLKKDSHINSFISFLNERLSQEQKDILIRQLGSRLDDEFNFFIRLDRKKLIKENIYHITDSGDCFHIRFSIAAFPKTKENAMASVRRIFGRRLGD